MHVCDERATEHKRTQTDTHKYNIDMLHWKRSIIEKLLDVVAYNRARPKQLIVALWLVQRWCRVNEPTARWLWHWRVTPSLAPSLPSQPAGGFSSPHATVLEVLGLRRCYLQYLVRWSLIANIYIIGWHCSEESISAFKIRYHYVSFKVDNDAAILLWKLASYSLNYCYLLIKKRLIDC